MRAPPRAHCPHRMIGVFLGGMASSRPRPRPRFEIESPLAPDEVVARLRAVLQSNRSVTGVAIDGRIELTIPRAQQHLWSPQLTVDVEARDEGSLLRARFGPHPHVWTMYVLLYALLGLAAVLVLIFALAEWIIDKTSWPLWIAPGLGVLAALVYGASFVGQGLGYEQMHMLRTLLTRTLQAKSVRPPPSGAPASPAVEPAGC